MRRALPLIPLLALTACYTDRRSPHESDASCVERLTPTMPFSQVGPRCASGPIAPDGRREIRAWRDDEGYAASLARSQCWPLYQPSDAEVREYRDEMYGVTPGGGRPE